MAQYDHYLPLAPDLELAARLETDGRLKVTSESEAPPEPGAYGWLLEVAYQARGRWALPAVTTRQDEKTLFTQYLEPHQAGRRLLNLTGIENLGNLRLTAERCRLAQPARLLGFRQPDLATGPVLIVAPHPDDAELAAYGLYRRHAAQTWIVTLSAGERQKRLDRQYLPGLDSDTAAASRRKGFMRTWNSATTPLLAGVAPERLVMLGYANDTLPELLEAPETAISSRGDALLTPAPFRRLNPFSLATDPAPVNRGRDLLSDLTELIERIRPQTLVVTHPEVDPHPDHIAAARACAQAMCVTSHRPERVLLYANHLKGVRGFPRGPAHAAAGPWPLQRDHSLLGHWGFYSERLDLECQKEKALAMDSMHDLRARLSMEKRVKRWLHRRLSGVPADRWKDYGDHDYFQTHIKAHEVFALVEAGSFTNAFAENFASMA